MSFEEVVKAASEGRRSFVLKHLTPDMPQEEIMDAAIESESMWLVHDLLDFGFTIDNYQLERIVCDGMIGIYKVVNDTKKLYPIRSTSHSRTIIKWLDEGKYDPYKLRKFIKGYDVTDVYEYCEASGTLWEAYELIKTEGCYDLS